MINKILFITRFLKGGGAERVVSVLASELAKEGIQVGVLSYIVSDKDYPLDKKVALFSMGKNYNESKGNSFSRTLYRRKKIRGVVRKFNPDIIVPFLKPIVQETVLTVGDYGIPILGTVRNLPQYGNRVQKVCYERILKKCFALYLQTESQKKYFSETLIEKSFVLPNPVDDSFLESGEKRIKETNRNQSKIIISVGRLEPQKNHKLLIKSMLEVHKIYPDYKLVIYGEGNLRNNLQGFIDDNKASDYISLPGRSAEMDKKLAKAEMFVLSSDFEGMPNALLEAMAAGTPSISTDCPTGPRELIDNDRNGLLVQMNNSKALADAIIYFIKNPEEARKKGNRAHRFTMNNFSAKIIAHRFMSACGKYQK